MPMGAGNSAELHLQPLATPKGLLLGLLLGAPKCVWCGRGEGLLRQSLQPPFPVSTSRHTAVRSPVSSCFCDGNLKWFRAGGWRGRPLLSVCTTLQKSKDILSVFTCST